MNVAAQGMQPAPGADTTREVIKLAVMAVGGQGGGVLTGWIESLARAEGYAVQATSVAGVAQRTGATIYYIEMARAEGGAPVFALAPAAGDVDILIAAECMEAGRAILRGFVTPDRTTLIVSSHRALAVSEKMVPGNGITDPSEVLAAAEIAARRVVMADMEALARDRGSVISASLFGALAGAGVLPFDRGAFEAAIRKGGKGVEASLAAFAAGFDASRGELLGGSEGHSGSTPERDGYAPGSLLQRIEGWPGVVQEKVRPGLEKVVAFQDVDYGAEYLDLVEDWLKLDHERTGWELTVEAAKHIANAMAYDDVIRVADEKTKATRWTRIAEEMGVGEGRVLHLTEFMHPRAEEIAGMLPVGMGRRVQGSPRWMARLDRWFGKGRRYRSDRLGPFLMLYVLGGMKRWRRRTLRHAEEAAHLQAWLGRAREAVGTDYALGVEILRCRRLIKGYSDTHSRGLGKFDRVMEGAHLVEGRDDAAVWVARLREAALQDEAGEALDGALRTVRSFAEAG